MTRPKLARTELPTDVIPKTLWIGAAALALFGHVAFAAFAVARMHDEPDDDDLGAPGIEIALELTSAPLAPSHLPPGPESDASAASSAVMQQEVEAKDVDLPKETPIEAEDPDRHVTIEKTNKPPEDDPQIKSQPVKPSEESVAHEATAPPAVPNATQAAKPTTRDQGTGQSEQRVRVTWQKELLAHLNKYKRYPTERNHQSAEITVTMRLDRTGRVLAATVAKSSGDGAFDRAALSMVERANPVPAPPPLVADEGLDFSLPVVFRKSEK